MWKKTWSLLIHGIKLKLIKGFGSFVSWVKIRTQMDRISKIELPTEILFYLISNKWRHADFHSALHAAIALIFHSIVHLTMTWQDVEDSEQWDAVNCHVQHRLILFRYYFRYFTYNIYILISYFKLLVDALSHFNGNSCRAVLFLVCWLYSRSI
jgi:hypothetical protein